MNPVSARAAVPPHWKGRTLPTPHFRVHFDESLEVVARALAGHLEEAHSLLAPTLHWEPGKPTEVLITDTTDSANGMATPYEGLGLVIYATPPEVWYSTTVYDDWLRILAFHEYTHFLQLDPARGLWRVPQVLLGKTIYPNLLWPLAWIEGYAVFMETRFSRSGRGRSPYWESILRSAVETEKLGDPDWITLDRVEAMYPRFPSGEIPYLFGYYLVDHLVRNQSNTAQGIEAIGQITERSSYRFPYLDNDLFRDVTGWNKPTLWNDWVTETRARFKSQLEQLKKFPTTSLHWLTDREEGIYGPRVSPDGQLLAYGQLNGDDGSHWMLRDLLTGQTSQLDKRSGGSVLSFSPDGQSLFGSAHRAIDPFVSASDLRYWDLKTRTAHWLSHGLRARDPEVFQAADGSLSVLFIWLRNQSANLAIAPLEKISGGSGPYQMGEPRILYAPPRFGRVSSIRVSPEGTRAVFSVRINGTPQEDLMEYRFTDQRVRVIFANGHNNRFPTFHPNGSLYFVSDRTGIDNLYRLESDVSATLTSNITTGISFPSFTPQGTVVSSSLRWSGQNLVQFTPSPDFPESAIEALTVPPAPTFAEPYPAPSVSPSQSDSSDPSSASTPTEPYSIWPTLLPRTWSPAIAINSWTTSFEMKAVGYDTAERLRYEILGRYHFPLAAADFGVALSTPHFGPTLGLSYNTAVLDIERLESGERQAISRVQNIRLNGHYAFAVGLDTSITPRFSIRFEQDKILSIPAPWYPRLDLAINWTDLETTRLGIGIESGYELDWGIRGYWQDQPTVYKNFVSGTGYLSLPAHAVIVGNLRAAWSTRFTPDLTAPNVLIRNNLASPIDRSTDSGLTQLPLRGYPGRSFASRLAWGATAEGRIPIYSLFSGPTGVPFFFRQLSARVLAESTFVFSASEPTLMVALPALGAGLSLTNRIFFHIPLRIALDFYAGLAETRGGKVEPVLSIDLMDYAF